jgi:hypothetical protein
MMDPESLKSLLFFIWLLFAMYWFSVGAQTASALAGR